MMPNALKNVFNLYAFAASKKQATSKQQWTTKSQIIPAVRKLATTYAILEHEIA